MPGPRTAAAGGRIVDVDRIELCGGQNPQRVGSATMAG